MIRYDLGDGVHDLTRELVAIVTLTNNAIAALDDGDPRREDLIEIRAAARLAMATLVQLGCSPAPMQRLVAS